MPSTEGRGAAMRTAGWSDRGAAGALELKSRPALELLAFAGDVVLGLVHCLEHGAVLRPEHRRDTRN